ncbi:MAG: hypothetical protein ACYTXI_15630 [Nostoc sp.]
MNFEDCKFTEALRSCLGKIANPSRKAIKVQKFSGIWAIHRAEGQYKDISGILPVLYFSCLSVIRFTSSY